jgi:hypothetical protein
VAVHIDKTGRNVQVARVDCPDSISVDVAYSDDSITSDADIRDDARCAASVENSAATNYKIVVERFRRTTTDGETNDQHHERYVSRWHFDLQPGIWQSTICLL